MVWELGPHGVGVPTVLGNIAVNGTNISWVPKRVGSVFKTGNPCVNHRFIHSLIQQVLKTHLEHKGLPPQGQQKHPEKPS